LVRAILDNTASGITIRGITRDANSDNAKALKDLGVEVVEADLDNAQKLEKAFQWAYVVFALQISGSICIRKRKYNKSKTCLLPPKMPM
jgi:uncharacterized protein YbjT (DUF2867 family)